MFLVRPRLKKILSALLPALLLLAVFSAVMTAGCTTVDKLKVKSDITLNNEHTRWSPAMSSIPGLDITPVYSPMQSGNSVNLINSSADAAEQFNADEITYHWNATGDSARYVMLLSWDSGVTGKVESLGNDTVTKAGETVWFCCKDYDPLSAPESYVIHLTAESDGKTLSERDVVILRKAMFYYLEDTYYGYNTRVVDADNLKTE